LYYEAKSFIYNIGIYRGYGPIVAHLQNPVFIAPFRWFTYTASTFHHMLETLSRSGKQGETSPFHLFAYVRDKQIVGLRKDYLPIQVFFLPLLSAFSRLVNDCV
jgi:hypothetical protein